MLFALSIHSEGASKTAEAFVIVEEPGVSGKVDRQQFSHCLQLMLRELGLEGRKLPRIIVYHLSAESALYLGINSSSIYRNTGGGYLRYEMWIIDKPSIVSYGQLLAQMLTSDFDLRIDEQARSRLANKVERALNSTVDVRTFR